MPESNHEFPTYLTRSGEAYEYVYEFLRRELRARERLTTPTGVRNTEACEKALNELDVLAKAAQLPTYTVT